MNHTYVNVVVLINTDDLTFETDIPQSVYTGCYITARFNIFFNQVK